MTVDNKVIIIYVVHVSACMYACMSIINNNSTIPILTAECTYIVSTKSTNYIIVEILYTYNNDKAFFNIQKFQDKLCWKNKKKWKKYKISLAETKVLYIYNNSKKAFACKLDNMVQTGKWWWCWWWKKLVVSSVSLTKQHNIVEPFCISSEI